ncbi:MAG: hypothetical protein ABI970_00135 [Chloroflexota bacterium]
MKGRSVSLKVKLTKKAPMPTQSHYDKSNKMIYHRYWAHMTGKEFKDSLTEEHKFFDQMTGKVGVVFDLTALENLPSSILTIARKAYFVRYQPLVIGLVGDDAFVSTMTHAIKQITHTSIYSFDAIEKAIAYMKTQIKPFDFRAYSAQFTQR